MSETRLVARWRTVSRKPGRFVVSLQCPFCDVKTEAYLWSLAGSGKRCECGAVHHARGRGDYFTTKEQQ